MFNWMHGLEFTPIFCLASPASGLASPATASPRWLLASPSSLAASPRCLATSQFGYTHDSETAPILIKRNFCNCKSFQRTSGHVKQLDIAILMISKNSLGKNLAF